MRVIVRTGENGDKIIEIEAPPEEIKSLFGEEIKSLFGEEIKSFLRLQPLNETQKKTESNTDRTSDNTSFHGVLPQSFRQLFSPDPSKWKLLVETESEVNSRTEQSKYNLYSSHNTNHIVGIINSNMRTYTVHLGNRSDPSSKISQIMKAVNAMPSNNTFTKKELSESLPSNLAKAHVLKLALDYMIHIGQVKRVRKDIETGAVLYQRLKSEDSSSNNLGSEAAEAINLNSSAL